MKRTLAISAALVTIALAPACTPEQRATIASVTGIELGPEWDALPDVPVPIGQTLFHPDGTSEPLPEEFLPPLERFRLAVSRSEWVNRPDMHRWLECVARRESNLDPRVHNYNARTHDDSYGYMQINLWGSMRAPRLANNGLTDAAQLFHPETNLNVAWNLFVAAGTGPWAATRGGCSR